MRKITLKNSRIKIEGGKVRVEEDINKKLARLPVNKRIAAKKSKKIRYKKGLTT